MMTFDTLLKTFEKCNWDDIETVNRLSNEVFEYLLSNKKVLTNLVCNIANSKELLGMCEYDAVLNKIVLFSNEGLRLRIHIFKDRCADRIHNHRWTFSAKVLCGEYVHTIFDNNLNLSEKLKYTIINASGASYEGENDNY